MYQNTLQVFYYDNSGGNLRHAWSADGDNWSFETLDGAGGINGRTDANEGQSPTVAVDNDSLQLFYRDATNNNLRHAWTSPTQGWQFETLDGDPASISGYSSDVGNDPVTIAWNGGLQVFDYDGGAKRLRHTWSDQTGWHSENMDGDIGSVCHGNGDMGKNPTTAIYNNQLHVFYYNSTSGNLRHAWSDTTQGWQCETLDGDPHAVLGNNINVGAMPTAGVVGNTLQVFAERLDFGGLQHYWADTTGWHSEDLDGFGGAPTGRSNHPTGADPIIVNYDGTAELFYYDQTNGNLRHALPQ